LITGFPINGQRSDRRFQWNEWVVQGRSYSGFPVTMPKDSLRIHAAQNFNSLQNKKAVPVSSQTECKEMEFLDISFNKRLESFAPCYSQFLLFAAFKKDKIR
jgi:hypothetical protein